MLKRLEIENYALIDRLEIEFADGFSAITGETGAGKSILLGALGLVLGDRADTQVLFNKDRKCIVEATFRITDYELESFFEVNALDHDDLAILRREIASNGKSRAFINDTPVNLGQLKELGDKLVNVHSQHETVTLNESEFQLAVVDSFAGTTRLLKEYRSKFNEYSRLLKELSEMRIRQQEAENAQEFNRFLLEELEEAKINPDEQEELEEKLNVLSHAEEIIITLNQVSGIISGGERNITGDLAEAVSLLRKISGYHSSMASILERLESDLVDIRDIDMEILRMSDSTETDPATLEQVRQRIDLIHHLQNKHHVNSCQELKQVEDNLRDSVRESEDLGDFIVNLDSQTKAIHGQLSAMADELSSLRTGSLNTLELEITSLLQRLGMPDARFEIKHERSDHLHGDGQDRVEFFFNANKGHQLKSLSSVASGGELSRVMLSIKSRISEKNLLPTIIFDEIDNGISGDIAGRVGDILLNTALKMQVIAITHMPQIAGKAHHHYTVFKISGNETTFSNIRKLEDLERIEELARMISGQTLTPASMAAARELRSPGKN